MLGVYLATILIAQPVDNPAEAECRPLTSVSSVSPGDIFVFEWQSNRPSPNGRYLGYTITEVDGNTVYANEWTYIHSSNEELNWDELAPLMHGFPVAREFSLFNVEFNLVGDREIYRSFTYEIDLSDALRGLDVGEQIVVGSTEVSVLNGARRTSESDVTIEFEGCSQREFDDRVFDVKEYRLQTSLLTRNENGTFDETVTDAIYSVDESVGWWVHAQYPNGQMVLRAHIVGD